MTAMSTALPEEPAQLGLRERKKQQTRQLIAETARALFAERGFEAVKVAEIARAADVSEKTVFNYFPTKEDLVYWRLEAFEAELLQTIRDREPGESVLAGFGRFILAQRGLLGQGDPEAREQLVAVTRMITRSPALQRREGEVFAGYTAGLAALIAEETGARDDDIRPRVVAHALMGVHQALIAYTRGRILAGAFGPRLGRDARRQAERALTTLEAGLGDYAVKRAPR
jgi:AcrR family transcriptional regulator